jgi:hypothetical protein
MKKLSFVVAVMGLLFVCASAAKADSFVITYGAPGALTASGVIVANANVLGVENFDSLPIGCGGFTTNYGTGGAITGTYSSGACIRTPTQFGGAGGLGQFVDAIGGTTGYTITLTTGAGVPGVNYFGFWLSALDLGNQLVFLNSGTVVGTFTPGDLIADLGACPEAYCGNPSGTFMGQDAGQQYAFVNFVDTTGFFNEIEVFESPDVGNYESDNHTVAYCSNVQACISGHVVGATPEPQSASLALLGAGLLGLGFFVKRFS